MIEELRECGVINTIKRMRSREKRMPLQPVEVKEEVVEVEIRRRGL